MRRLGVALGIVVGLLLGVAGFALGVVGLMAMGTTTPKLVVFIGGLILLVTGTILVVRSVLSLRRVSP